MRRADQCGKRDDHVGLRAPAARMARASRASPRTIVKPGSWQMCPNGVCRNMKLSSTVTAMAGGQQLRHEDRAEVAGAAGYEDPALRPSSALPRARLDAAT